MNNYTLIDTIKQSENVLEDVLIIPAYLKDFINYETRIFQNDKKELLYEYVGKLKIYEGDIICPNCNCKLHKHSTYTVNLKHIPVGLTHTRVLVTIQQFQCEKCKYNKSQKITFKNENFRITQPLFTYTENLLNLNKYTLTDISFMTGIDRKLIFQIDKERLKRKYIVDGKLIKPITNAKYLAIDEFKLHNGYIFATHIIDLETGNILWIAKGKKKQVVYDFIEHVGLEWMSKVIAVACDMNSDFEEAFKETCSHIIIIYDYFHIIKNFNEKVVDKVRIDLQKELKENNDDKGSKMLKNSKYILNSNQETLIEKDIEATEGKIIRKESELFNIKEVKRSGKNMEKFTRLINEYEILFVVELIREFIRMAYASNDRQEMEKIINEIIEFCDCYDNKHLRWFRNLLLNHIDGILTHAEIKISTGKIEGINNKIKTVRRQAYGFTDDEYFFLKCMDLSRN